MASVSDLELMEELNCRFVRASLWDYGAGDLAEPVSRSVSSHLGSCRDCDLRRLEVSSMRTGLRQLPVKTAPPMVEIRLKVLASRERSRLLARRDFSAWLRDKRSRAKLLFDHLLKPFAVPAMGGLLASFLCFGVLVDNLQLRSAWDGGKPLGLFTQVTIADLSPFCSRGRDVMVELTVDADGSVTDYTLPPGQSTPEEMQEIGNLILYSRFTPATRFGQPVSSKLFFNISHVSVKG